MAVSLLLTIPVLLTHRWELVFVAAVLLEADLRPRVRRLVAAPCPMWYPPAGAVGTMSAFYLLAYTAMAVPTLVAGWAATRWDLTSVFPWFAGAVALACLGAAGAGLHSTRRRVT